MESAKGDSRNSRIAIPKAYATQMAAFGAYATRGTVLTSGKTKDECCVAALWSVRWILYYHPQGYFCVTAEMFKEHLTSKIDAAILDLERKGAKGTDFIRGLRAEAHIDTKCRLRIPYGFVSQAHMTPEGSKKRNAIFTHLEFMIQIWPEEVIQQILSIPVSPKESQGVPVSACGIPTVPKETGCSKFRS